VGIRAPRRKKSAPAGRAGRIWGASGNRDADNGPGHAGILATSGVGEACGEAHGGLGLEQVLPPLIGGTGKSLLTLTL
jgi:hypothetical protein